jgi:hypothetical protein
MLARQYMMLIEHLFLPQLLSLQAMFMLHKRGALPQSAGRMSHRWGIEEPKEHRSLTNQIGAGNHSFDLRKVLLPQPPPNTALCSWASLIWDILVVRFYCIWCAFQSLGAWPNLCSSQISEKWPICYNKCDQKISAEFGNEFCYIARSVISTFIILRVFCILKPAAL